MNMTITKEDMKKLQAIQKQGRVFIQTMIIKGDNFVECSKAANIELEKLGPDSLSVDFERDGCGLPVAIIIYKKYKGE